VSKSRFDRLSELATRRLAGFTSRRGFLSRLSVAMLAAPVLPLLPVARSTPAPPSNKTDFERHAQSKDANKCDYWRYCAISWIGTCLNPDDGRSYVIAYRDCCGKPVCEAGKDCDCHAVDRELPTYRQPLNNDIIWCFGNATATYHCSTAALVGAAS
jgi:methylamine dehydrogenase light chain